MDAPRDVVLFSIRRDTLETEELVRSLGSRVVERVVQVRSRPDPDTYLGRGKLEEFRRRLSGERPPPTVSGRGPLAVVDAALKPPQLFGIEDVLRLEVWDRIRLILEIFQHHARVKEAKLQVELARLRYELPFVHEALHRTLTGEHPGFMGGGELPMRTYETHLKRRTKKIQGELRTIRKERARRREGRRRTGFRLVAIAGYTNSGKSSLLNALCGSEAFVENLYFSTLQTTTRRLKPAYVRDRHTGLLFTDTVGFIRDLPPWLIDAFAATLEEVAHSDVILLVLDASEPPAAVRSKLDTAWSILDELGATKRRFVLLNKADLVPAGSRNDIHNTLLQDSYYLHMERFWISTRTSEGLESIVEALVERTLPFHEVRVQIDRLNASQLSLESWLRDHTDIVSESTNDQQTELVARCSREEYPRLRARAQKAGVPLRPEPSTGSKGGGGAPASRLVPNSDLGPARS